VGCQWQKARKNYGQQRRTEAPTNRSGRPWREQSSDHSTRSSPQHALVTISSDVRGIYTICEGQAIGGIFPDLFQLLHLLQKLHLRFAWRDFD
jgi:hypothetical protein